MVIVIKVQIKFHSIPSFLSHCLGIGVRFDKLDRMVCPDLLRPRARLDTHVEQSRAIPPILQ